MPSSQTPPFEIPGRPDLSEDLRNAIAGVAVCPPLAAQARTGASSPRGIASDRSGAYREEPARRALPLAHPPVLGIGGRKRAGKDLLAQHLERTYAGVVRIQFSDPILREVNAFLAPLGHVITHENKDHPLYRQLLQAWGFGRTIGCRDYWVSHVVSAVSRTHAAQAAMVVVTGVRLPQDIVGLRAAGATLWLVLRPNLPVEDDHPVERALDRDGRDLFDAVLRNDVEGDVRAFLAHAEATLAGRATRPRA